MKKLATSVRCVAPVGAILGEGPIFDPRIGKLLFLDIKGERIFVYDPESEAVKSILAPGQISALGLRAAGGYVCASRNGFGFLDLEDGIARLQLTTDPESDLPGNRFNDGKVDSFGGFWAGTMDDMEKDANAGSWWRRAAPSGERSRRRGRCARKGCPSPQPLLLPSRCNRKTVGDREVRLYTRRQDRYPGRRE